jgi:hypothetical protein
MDWVGPDDARPALFGGAQPLARFAGTDICALSSLATAASRCVGRLVLSFREEAGSGFASLLARTDLYPKKNFKIDEG